MSPSPPPVSYNHNAGSFGSHLENFTPLKEKKKKDLSSSVYLTSNPKVRPSDEDKHFTLSLISVIKCTHSCGKTDLSHKFCFSRFAKLLSIRLANVCALTASWKRFGLWVLPDFSNSLPNSFHLLSLQLILTAWLKVLVRKEVNCLSNTVFHYKQPFFFSAFSTTFLLRSLFFFSSFPYKSLSNILVLQSVLEGDLRLQPQWIRYNSTESCSILLWFSNKRTVETCFPIVSSECCNFLQEEGSEIC